jgi:hypothetical protein
MFNVQSKSQLNPTSHTVKINNEFKQPLHQLQPGKPLKQQQESKELYNVFGSQKQLDQHHGQAHLTNNFS